MREILFRGKRIDNGEWKHGSYANQYRCHEILLDGVDCEYGFDHYHIIPETVGQYTGLKDKNGKRIFEGDILQTGTIKGEVVWSENRAEYCLLWKDYGKQCDFFKSPNLASFAFGRDMEVIGNIHDNPELLEET